MGMTFITWGLKFTFTDVHPLVFLLLWGPCGVNSVSSTRAREVWCAAETGQTISPKCRSGRPPAMSEKFLPPPGLCILIYRVRKILPCRER